MIKFTAGNDDGTTLVGLGISEGNVSKLKEGKPIRILLSEMIPDKQDGDPDLLRGYGTGHV